MPNAAKFESRFIFAESRAAVAGRVKEETVFSDSSSKNSPLRKQYNSGITHTVVIGDARRAEFLTLPPTERFLVLIYFQTAVEQVLFRRSADLNSTGIRRCEMRMNLC
jgi:hypothetical protein